ncbi:ATPase H+ transporting accessory protein 1 like a isoform X1 [Chiloscyllium plagiosum]|uniref:ATPase H+ transporting accessory protein 1 like a isoform X1 n=1 Tax=Chiloscyllium plagiosum TaxID=36176 RepID=UPI001CB7D7A2|nr:ATPase H+ transporting accessory protein 1 like a isoform X1 [Chiloscyllium plagiosum]
METYKIQCLTISLLMRLSVTADHTVPVIMWSSAKALWKTVNIPHQEHNGSHKEALELFRYLSSAVNRGPKKVILFWQNELNIHDIITVDGKLAHTFSNIQNALDSSPSSIILPAVNQHWTNQLPRYLQQKLGEDPILVNYLPFWNPGLSSTKSSLLIVKLSSKHRPAMVPDTKFLSDDDVIKLVTSALKANNIPYTAIFTAGRSSQVVRHAFNEVMNTGRHLLQIPSWNQYPPINVTDGEMPCILFIAKKVTLRIGDQPEIDLTNRTFGSTAPKINTRDSTCTADKAMLSLNYGDVGNLKQLVIRFEMSYNYHTTSVQKWFSLDFVQIFHNNSLQAIFNASEIYAPVTNSYHCQYISSLQKHEALLVSRFQEDRTRLWHITFVEFQIQGFNIKVGHFASARDCASFFTPAVLMGLVISLILVLVLAYAGHMLIHLKRMEEYN